MYRTYHFIYVDKDGRIKKTIYAGELKWCIKSFGEDYPNCELIKIQRYDYYGIIHNECAKNIKNKIR